MQEAFSTVISAPCLRIPNPDGDFKVTTDALEEAKAVGAVLTQDGHCWYSSAWQ
jgi:hypothetical protein